MGKSFVQPGDVLDLIAPTGGVLAGKVYLIGSLPVIAVADAAAGASFEGYVTGVHDVPKTASQAWTAGALIYVDNTNHVATNVATANTRLGVATQDVAGGAGDIIGRVRLSGVGGLVAT